MGKDRDTIAVDFDGVIHRYSKGWCDGTVYDVPMLLAHESLAQLVKLGYRVVIFTTRLNPEIPNQDFNLQKSAVISWLDANSFQLNVHYHDITAQKPIAKVYVDDRALHFTSWEEALKIITKKE